MDVPRRYKFVKTFKVFVLHMAGQAYYTRSLALAETRSQAWDVTAIGYASLREARRFAPNLKPLRED